MLIAHRGGVKGTQIIENSIAAFRRAMTNPKVLGIEFDVRLHGVTLVVHHDPLPETLPGYVPTLEEVLQLAQSYRYQGVLNIELKEYGLALTLEDVLKKYPELHPNILISSFLHPVVACVKELPSLRQCSFGVITACWPMWWKYFLEDRGMKWVIRYDSIPPELVPELERHAENIFLYTVNDGQVVNQYLSKGFNVISDVI